MATTKESLEVQMTSLTTRLHEATATTKPDLVVRISALSNQGEAGKE